MYRGSPTTGLTCAASTYQLCHLPSLLWVCMNNKFTEIKRLSMDFFALILWEVLCYPSCVSSLISKMIHSPILFQLLIPWFESKLNTFWKSMFCDKEWKFVLMDSLAWSRKDDKRIPVQRETQMSPLCKWWGILSRKGVIESHWTDSGFLGTSWDMNTRVIASWDQCHDLR